MAQASDVLAVAVREIGTVEQSGNRQKYEDYRAQLQKQAGLEDKTMDYLAAYKYGSDLIRKLATMK